MKIRRIGCKKTAKITRRNIYNYYYAIQTTTFKNTKKMLSSREYAKWENIFQMFHQEKRGKTNATFARYPIQ